MATQRFIETSTYRTREKEPKRPFQGLDNSLFNERNNDIFGAPSKNDSGVKIFNWNELY